MNSAPRPVAAVLDAWRRGQATLEQALGELALDRVRPLLAARIPSEMRDAAIARGVGISTGVAQGVLCFDASDVEAARARGERAIIAGAEFGREDVSMLRNCCGAVATGGSLTSHGAILCRGLGIAGVFCMSTGRIDDGVLHIFDEGRRATFTRGQQVTVDGTSGVLVAGNVRGASAEGNIALRDFVSACRDHTGVQVRAEAASVDAIARAAMEHCSDIGLCRLEDALATAATNDVARVIRGLHEAKAVRLDVRLYGEASAMREQLEVLASLRGETLINAIVPLVSSVADMPPASDSVKIGAMIETLAALDCVEAFADKAAFLVFGTGDLQAALSNAPREAVQTSQATAVLLDALRAAHQRVRAHKGDAHVFVAGPRAGERAVIELAVDEGMTGVIVAPQDLAWAVLCAAARKAARSAA